MIEQKFFPHLIEKEIISLNFKLIGTSKVNRYPIEIKLLFYYTLMPQKSPHRIEFCPRQALLPSSPKVYL